MEIAKVSALQGKFYAKDGNGNIRELKVGDSIAEGEVVFGDKSNSANHKIEVTLNNDVTAQVKASNEQIFDATMSATAHGNEEMSFSIAAMDAFLRHGDMVDIVSDLREADFVSEDQETIADGADSASKEGKEILDEETTEGNEEAEGGELNLNFNFRDGNTVDVISDLRKREFATRSQNYKDENRFENDSEGRLGSELRGTRYTDITTGRTTTPVVPQTFAENKVPTPPASPLTPLTPATPETSVTTPPASTPIEPPKPESSTPSTPTPALTTVVLKVFAAGSDGVVLKDVDGNYLLANSVNEGANANYIVYAFNEGTTKFNDDTKVDGFSGSVDIDFVDGTASGMQDYNNAKQTVDVGVSFNTATLDDYIADNGEKFNVSIVDESYTGSKGGFDIVKHDTESVTTTILDNSKPADENTPHDPNDTDEHTTETDKEIILIKLFAAGSDGAVLKDVNGDYLLANSVLEGNEANYIAYAFESGTTVFNDSTILGIQVGKVDVNFSDNTAEGVATQTLTNGTQDFNNTAQTITLGQSFSTEVFNDIINEGNENYTVNIVNGSYVKDTLNGGYESVAIDTTPVTTTISDLTSKVFVKIEPEIDEIGEGGNLKYKVTLVDENGNEVVVPSGKTVTVELKYEEEGSSPATKDGDYTPVTSVTIEGGTSSKEFEVPTIDDYFAEGDETFKITINSVTNPDNIFESIVPHTIANGAGSDKDKVNGTIKDNPSKVEQLDTGTGNDDPTTGNYGQNDTVYVKITHNDSTVEGGNLTHTVTLVDKNNNPVTVPTGETITVTITYNPDATLNADYTTPKTTIVTIGGGNSSTTITHTTVDDFVGEGNEVYTATITDVTQDIGSFENVAIHATENSATGTIRDGVTLGDPVDTKVYEDGLNDGSDTSENSLTNSLGITNPNNDAYTVSFDKTITACPETSNGQGITYSYNPAGTLLTATRTDGATVFTVELKKVAGNDVYDFKLFEPMDHEYGNNGKNEFNLPFEFNVTSDGTTSSNKTFNVVVVDSIPVATDKIVEVNEDSSVVIRISNDEFKDGKITINGNEINSGSKADIFDPNDGSKKIGDLTNNGNGTLTFVPIEDYSNYAAKPSFTYTVEDFDGDTATATVEIDVKPITDAPTVSVNNVSTTEDNGNTAEGTHSIALDLTLPSLSKDQTDKNGVTGDNPERNGYIELKFTNGSSVNGAVLEKADGADLATISNHDQTIKIYISDLGANYHHSGLDPVADGAIQLTQAEYAALRIIHAEDNDRDISINIKVTSYEVDDGGVPLAGVAGATDDKTMTVKIHPATDDISLAWNNNASGLGTYVGDTFTFNTVDEGGYFATSINLQSLLTKTSGYESPAGSSGDLDGSEKRTYTIEGIPEGSIVTLGGQSTTANASGVATIVFNDANNKDADPEFSMKLPEQYSGTITNAKITLSVQDRGVDSGDTAGAVKTAEVYFNVSVNPIADIATLQIKQAIGNEDAGRSNGNSLTPDSTIDEPQNGIVLDIKVSSDDKDGSETFIVRIDDVPNGGHIYYRGGLFNENGFVSGTNVGGITISAGTAADTWKIVIEDFQNDQLPKFIPPHNSDEDYTFKINAKTVDGSDESDWLTTDKDMQVTVKDIADVPVGAELNNNGGYAYTTVENVLDNGTNKFDLKDVYVNSALLDSYDGDSETLSIVISNLTSGFGVEGASLIGNGVWTFLATDINNVKITTPENFSGEATFNLKYITTEDAGDSKTHYTDTVKIFVSPSAEATISTATTASEDVLTKVDFGIAHQNGDTNETLQEIRIKASDVDGQDFTLYIGNGTSTPISTLTPIGGYYVLTAAQADNVYAKNTTEHEHGTYTFKVGYTVRDSESDKGTSDDKVVNDMDYTLTINAVTDTPTATLETISGGAGYSVSGSTVSVSVEDTTFGIPVKLTSPDMDGSESVTRYVITGVPMGVEVIGGTYYGYAGSVHNGIWVLDIADEAINDANGHTESIQFKVNQGADFETRNITIEAFNQDVGASEESDSITFTLEKTYTPSGVAGTPPEFTLTGKEVTILEDVAFNLGSALGVTKTGGGLSGGFAVTITDLPEGSSVSGHSYSYVENGVTRYVITGTGGNAADVMAKLSQVTITPPANINDSDSSTQSMTFTTTIATYHNGTFYSGNTLNYSEHILPVTDDMTIAINASGTDEDVSTNFTITLSNDADVVTEIIDGKLYIKVTENYADGGFGETAVGSLVFGGTTLGTTTNPGGLVGDYYVIDISSYSMGTPLNFTFNPGDNRHGNVTIEAVVKNKEGHGWDTSVHDTVIQTSSGSTTIAVSPVIDGFDPNDIQDSIGDEATGTDLNRIKLDISATLSDPSESIGSATLDKVPSGFLIFYGDNVNNLKLAINTGNSLNHTEDFILNPEGDASTVKYNQWLIPLSGGELPSEIWIQAPQNWSGTLDDVVLDLFALSDGNKISNESYEFGVTFTPVADGLTIDPTLTFGKVYDWVDLKINANMKDVDGSEKMYLEIGGLDDMAQFRLNNGDSVEAEFANDKWTLKDIEYDQVNNVQLLHNKSVDEVTVDAWTVESENGDKSNEVSGSFELLLEDVSGKLSIPSGAHIDFDKIEDLSTLKNISEIELSSDGSSSIENLSMQDVVEITDSSNDIKITGDNDDNVSLKNEGGNWSKSNDTQTEDVYVNSGDNTVKVTVEDDIHTTIV